jgi:hypothetical protein
MTLGLMERLVEEDFGLVANGSRWSRAEEHDSLVVDSEKQIFFYNSLGISGTPLTYLIKIRGLSYKAAIEYLKQFKDFSDTIIYEYRGGDETIVYPKLVEVFHENLLKGNKDYFYSRAINDETISRFQLGLDEGWAMIPFFVGGVFKNFQKRRDYPNKRIFSYYKRVGPLLFNSDVMRITSKIYITEAPTSCLVMNQNGIPSISFSAGADAFQEDWYAYFINQKKIVLLYDNDSAGNFGSILTSKILGLERCRIYNFWDMPEKGYDAGNFFEEGGTKEQLVDLVEEKSKFAYELPEWKKYEKRK